MVVDDSSLIHLMYKMALSRYKCTILEAKERTGGSESAGQEPDIDLILLDINMPIMSGLEFLQEVQELGSYSTSRLLSRARKEKEEDTNRGMEMGAAGYITKPVQMMKLHSMIEKLVPSP